MTFESHVVIAELERRRGPQLFSFALRLGLSEDEAQDAVQEALLRLWRELGRSEIENPDAWAYTALRRIAMDHHRLRRRLRGLAERLQATRRPAAGQADHHEIGEREAVWNAVDRLPMRQRQAVYLRFRGDFDYAQIGRILGIRESAARSYVTKGLDRLEQELER